MNDRFDACIFDFGGVLTTPVLEAFAEFERAMNLDAGTLLKAFRHGDESDAEPDFFLLEKGLISEGEFYRRMFERVRHFTGLDLAFPDDPAAVRRHLFGSLRPNEEIIAAAISIAAHYKTAILTNNVKEWTDWREIASAHQFHLVVDSSTEGIRKPDPEIYLVTCERLGVEPARAVFIDDIPSNVRGAEAVGLHAIRFTTTQAVLAELEELFPRAFESKERDASHA